jgi:hypothetical protein
MPWLELMFAVKTTGVRAMVLVALALRVIDAVALEIVMVNEDDVDSGVVPLGTNSANTCGLCGDVKVCLNVATPLASVTAVPKSVTAKVGELTRDWNLTVWPAI